jgi:steroid delta-isomerase-like uncharacterized protein
MNTPLRTLFLIAALAFSVTAAGGEKENVVTAKRVLLEKMGEGRFDKLDEIYGEGFVAHGPTRDFTLEEDNESGKEWRRAFPDLTVTVKRTAADGDLVAVHWNAKGTNTVAAAGLPGKDGKADMDGMTFFRFKNGKIVEEWSVMDIATMVAQLKPATSGQ